MSNNEPIQRADSSNPRRADREANISPDGKWKSFPRVPHLLQYVPSGIFFGRIKLDGKIVRESLKTDTFTTAKLRLGDFIKKQRKNATRPVTGTVSEARTHYERDVDADHTLKETSKLYRKNTIKALLRTWPELDALAPAKVTESDCRAWAGRFAAKFDDQFFNNTLSSLRHVLEKAGLPREENPAFKIKRLGVKPKELKLPEPSEYEQILGTMETAGARQSKDCANLVRFLAYSGCRISEAQEVRWSDVRWPDKDRNVPGEIRVQSAKRSKSSHAAAVRFVPIIPAMLDLLLKLRQSNPKPDDLICNVGECEKSLTRACKLVKVHRITHHDLRHLFATRCIEAGVDIPTVSKWLGHSDGGALAMRTYGHLRREHSAAMAQRVTFAAEQPKAATV